MSNQKGNDALLDSVSFAGLFDRDFLVEGGNSHPINRIVIPRIQRDYAQGRSTVGVKRVRDRFLAAIKESLCADKILRLDFVYGDIDKKGIFTPFDGQQRLTTLFLLHWYAIQLLQNKTDAMRLLLARFSYETRPSARRFCEGLANGDFDIDIRSKDSVSTQIRNCSRFVMSWNSDPTVSGMLCMLDAISKEFAQMDKLWSKLVTQELIQFYVLPMSDMGLDDKLYIKMNARGKPLTNFEHFKAEFEREAEKCSEALRKEIAYKYDTRWTDAFFDYRDKVSGVVDGAFLNYFRFISQIICWRDDMRYEDYEDDEFKIVTLYSGRTDRFDFFCDMMNCWVDVNAKDLQHEYFSEWEHADGKVTLFKDDIDLLGNLLQGGQSSKRERLLLFAITLYLQNSDTISSGDFRIRLRVLRNLVFNSQDEIRSEKMKSIFDECEKLVLTGALPTGKNGLNTNQKEDESRKAEYLKSAPHDRLNIERIEDLNLFRGGLSILHESNYVRSDVLVSIASYIENNGWGLVQRAMLTYGDYSQAAGRNRCFGSDDCRYLQELFQPSNQRGNFLGTKAVFNQLIESVDSKDVEGSLKSIVSDFLKNCNQYDWKYYFVKYSDGVCGCYGKCLWWHHRRGYSFNQAFKDESPYEITLLYREQLNGQNWNWFLYVLSTQPELEKYSSLGNYSYNGDLLEVRRKRKVTVDCFNDHFLITLSDGSEERLNIPQKQGLDAADRIQLAISKIKSLAI